MTDAQQAEIGHNNPPEKTPLELASDLHENLSVEAENWLDDQPIENQAQADEVARIIEVAAELEKSSLATRKELTKPFKDAAKEIEADWKPILDDSKEWKEAGKSKLAKWEAKQAALKRERDEIASREAEAKRKAAEEAVRTVDRSDLSARREAERDLKTAQKHVKIVAKDAKKDQRTKIGGRRIAVKTVPQFVKVTDSHALLEFLFERHRMLLDEAAEELAKGLVSRGASEVPGVEIEMKEVGV